jgi:hypothetical protein
MPQFIFTLNDHQQSVKVKPINSSILLTHDSIKRKAGFGDNEKVEVKWVSGSFKGTIEQGGKASFFISEQPVVTCHTIKTENQPNQMLRL